MFHEITYFTGEHSWILTEPDLGVEIPISHSGCQTHRTLLQGAVPGQCLLWWQCTLLFNILTEKNHLSVHQEYIYSFLFHFYQAMSPDGEAIVTGAGDETLRFWNVFSKTRSTKVTKHFFSTSVSIYWAPDNLQKNHMCFLFLLFQESVSVLNLFTRIR